MVGQNLQEGKKRWSAEERLTVDDYKIKNSDINNEAVYSRFMISHAVSGFDFMKRNLNQRIVNLFLGNASWIDTTKVASLEKHLDFQQLQFDLAEVYARKFRKRLWESKGKITTGFDIVNKIENEIMSGLSEARVQMVKETKGGNDEKKVGEWKAKIESELIELEEFRFENVKKIKKN